MTNGEEIAKATERLKEEIAKAFGIYKFLDWLTEHAEKIKAALDARRGA